MAQNFSNKHEIEAHVKVLKSFYEEFSFYAIISLGLVVIWLLNGAGYFWPIWPMVIWGVPLLLKASRIGVIDESIYNIFNHLRHTLPIFKPEWEEEKIQQLIQRHEVEQGIKPNAQPTTVAPKKAVKKSVKNAAPKVATKVAKPVKKAVKKAVAKKAPPKKKK